MVLRITETKNREKGVPHNKMTYKALFLDIDGTILKPDHTYTDLTKEAITQAQQRGLDVFLATGRPAHEIDEIARDLNIDSVIGYNGAYATYKGEVIVDKPMDAELVDEFLTISNEKGNEVVLYMNGKNLYTSLNHPSVKHFIDFFQVKNNDVFDKKYIGDILSVTLLNMNSIEPQRFQIDPDIHLAPVHLEGLEDSYDVIRKSVNKGKTVTTLLNRLNIAKDEAIAFGDGMNDKEMLQAVGHGFAMGNAHVDLFDYATYRTTTVDESGIHAGLKKLGIV